jgi:hypothetical protein
MLTLDRVAPDSEVVIDTSRSMNIDDDVLQIIHKSEAMPGTRIFNSPQLTWTNISPTAGLLNHNNRPFLHAGAHCGGLACSLLLFRFYMLWEIQILSSN